MEGGGGLWGGHSPDLLPCVVPLILALCLVTCALVWWCRWVWVGVGVLIGTSFLLVGIQAVLLSVLSGEGVQTWGSPAAACQHTPMPATI